MTKRENAVKIGGIPVNLLGTAIERGAMAPDFTLLDNDMNSVSLSDYKGKIRVLSVMTSVDTSVCANQTRRFNEEVTKLDDVVVFTISVDLPFALKRFCGAEGIQKVLTLSDHAELDFGMKYGFVIEGKRLLARGVVVIDKNDKVNYVEYVDEVTHEPNYEAALNVVNELVALRHRQEILD